MSDRAKPWLDGPDFLDRHLAFASDEEGALAAAAPALARALCRVEWGSFRDISDYGTREEVCPACCCHVRRFARASVVVGGHAANCPLDAALTAAGLTAEDREEVRRG